MHLSLVGHCLSNRITALAVPHGTTLYLVVLKGWPSMGSSAQGISNGTATPAMYGAGPQAGYGTGQDLFGQSTNYASPGAYGAFAPQQAGYGGSQVQPTPFLMWLQGRRQLALALHHSKHTAHAALCLICFMFCPVVSSS